MLQWAGCGIIQISAGRKRRHPHGASFRNRTHAGSAARAGRGRPGQRRWRFLMSTIPTVYFIDDSATMREVIKIAFRRENITVITAGDAASAIAQFEQTPPDAVITDVIMPDQDGYAVCSQIKQHPQFSATPVILMSGVVNKSVADKAVSVGADELLRKPFQPVDLIARVKSFLEPKSPAQPAVPALATPRV